MNECKRPISRQISITLQYAGEKEKDLKARKEKNLGYFQRGNTQNVLNFSKQYWLVQNNRGITLKFERKGFESRILCLSKLSIKLAKNKDFLRCPRVQEIYCPFLRNLLKINSSETTEKNL